MATTVSLENLTPGMVTSEPVLNCYGQLLLGKGTALTLRHLNVFKTWGIEKISIESGQKQDEERVLDKTLLNKARAKIQQRLSWKPETPLEKEIIELAVEQEVKRFLRSLQLEA